jgi:hypothetical protein
VSFGMTVEVAIEKSDACYRQLLMRALTRTAVGRFLESERASPGADRFFAQASGNLFESCEDFPALLVTQRESAIRASRVSQCRQHGLRHRRARAVRSRTQPATGYGPIIVWHAANRQRCVFVEDRERDG